MAENTVLTTDAARLFLKWLESGDAAELVRILDHPGYLAVRQHSATRGDPISAADVIDAVAGRPSPMYGLSGVKDNMSRILEAVDYMEASRNRIAHLVVTSVTRIFPADLVFPVGLHCIVGYDWGIGLAGRVAINLNSNIYLDDLREIDHMLIHEAAHAAYERAHGPMNPEGLEEPGGLRHLVCSLVHNEGVAVYSALDAGVESGGLGNQDYRPLSDPAVLKQKTAMVRRLLAGPPEGVATDKMIDRTLSMLSAERLSYVVGCSEFMQLQRLGGLDLVREAVLWNPEEFVARSIWTR